MSTEEEYEWLRADYISKIFLHVKQLQALRSTDYQKSGVVSELTLLHSEATVSYMALVKMILVLKLPSR